ncbi:hypothetical protein BLNAU_18735 [Blattamonas nauphoetae]|uniref:Uncharacterized protein n=1 Tax=Blattamonas nauphoetae TaxID=2049346 RepID=A0ABQ9X4Y0_9EUKA|nr:hypothetical protein BLNAU_18735 [Blattamonas nauphoetae]
MEIVFPQSDSLSQPATEPTPPPTLDCLELFLHSKHSRSKEKNEHITVQDDAEKEEITKMDSDGFQEKDQH